MCDLFGDDAAAKADVARIEDGGLAGGGALDRLREREVSNRFGVVGILTDRTVSFWTSGNCAVDERGGGEPGGGSGYPEKARPRV